MKSKNKLYYVLIFIVVCVMVISLYCRKVMSSKGKIDEPNPIVDVTGAEYEYKFLKLENNSKNMIYSPLSIKYAFSILSEGASGNTKKQIDEVINSNNLKKYQNIENVLSLANSVFIRDSFKNSINSSYIDNITSNYDVSVIYDTFQSANNINKWVSDKTFKIIDKIIDDNAITPELQLVLINALAIDMQWEEKFDFSKTYESGFYLSNGEKIDATTMNKNVVSDNASYYIDDNVTALKMNLKKYNDYQFEFIAVMPQNNLSDYINNFDSDKLNNITNNMKKASSNKRGINISIPKFSYDYDLELKDDLISLGITDAFDREKADFIKMSSDKLFVSNALHKAKIDFSEEGIKAAAVTAIMMENGAIFDQEKPVDVIINKPFLYIIRDKETKEIWFVGTVYEPNLWENDKEKYEQKMY